MLASEFVEAICAAHLSSYVESPYQERGGLMVVGAPGVLKSTFVSVLERNYHDAIMISDLNAKTLVQTRDAIANGTVKTLVLPELAKLYERHPQTASNVEGTLRAMVGEGFAAASFEDQRINRLRARCMVIGALTPKTQTDHFVGWEDSGFNRRFLWSLVRLDDPAILERAVLEWQLINFQLSHVPRPPLTGEPIPSTSTKVERGRIRELVRYQPGGSHVLHMQLLSKMLSVLRYWYAQSGDPRNAMDVIERFSLSLGRDGDMLILEEPSRANTRNENKQQAHYAASALAKRRWEKKKGRPVKKSASRHKRR